MDTIFTLLFILAALYFVNKTEKLENFATFTVPPGTDPATAKQIGKAQEVGAQMCANSELDHANQNAKKKHNSCSE